MRTITKHKKKALQPKLLELLTSNKEFEEKGFIYVITSKKEGEGDIKGITIDRLKAKRLCFTKVKKTRKAYYTKVVYDFVVPKNILDALSKELEAPGTKDRVGKTR